MGELLKVEKVIKSYGKKEVLKQISFEVGPGKIVGLLGPNGSGKSTTIKLINGLIKQDSGTITVKGNTPGVETKKVVSYLPERTYLNNWMVVKDIVDFFQDFYADFDRARAEEMFEKLDIELDVPLKTMSKGTKEKVQLILVMSRRAELYILDEPIGGVDPAARDYILKTIIQNYSETSSIIIATHLIQEIESICDEVIFIKKGEVLLQGNTDDIREEKGKSIDELFREVFAC